MTIISIQVLHYMSGFWALLKEKWNTNKAMVQDLCQAHKTEPHAKSKKSSRACNIGNTTHLLRFAEPFRVRFLYENIDDSHVALCIVVNLTLYCERHCFIGYPLSPPSIVLTLMEKSGNSSNVVQRSGKSAPNGSRFGDLQVLLNSFLPRMQNSCLSLNVFLFG